MSEALPTTSLWQCHCGQQILRPKGEQPTEVCMACGCTDWHFVADALFVPEHKVPAANFNPLLN